MEKHCRLCCSTKFVINNIFDDENALYLKMSLLPVKVFKNDQLPQRICNKCSCKVNDLYQFCNEAIEAETRLRKILSTSNLADLVVKSEENGSPMPIVTHLDQTTQTDSAKDLSIKKEPHSRTPSPVKVEIKDNDNINENVDNNSCSSPGISDCDDSNEKNDCDEKKANVKKKKKDSGFKVDVEFEEIDSIPDDVDSDSDGNVNLDSIKRELDEDWNKQKKKKPKDYYCCICFEKFEKKIPLLKHYKRHAVAAENLEALQPPPFNGEQRCGRCRKLLTDEVLWKAHWLNHFKRDRQPYRCSLCEKSFTNHHKILKHGLTHKIEPSQKLITGPEKRFVCDICPEGFYFMRSLLAHRYRAHPDAISRVMVLRCQVCGREFSQLASLRRHQKSHTGEKNYLCNVCGKAVSTQEHLKFHLRIHEQYKPHVCKTCNKGFVKKCNLKLHERVHSGEKPHACSCCGKAFAQRSSLVIHERLHTGERPYTCRVCGRGFVARGLLTSHEKFSCLESGPPRPVSNPPINLSMFLDQKIKYTE